MRDEWKRSTNGIWTGMLAAAQVAPPDGRISPKTNRVDRNGYESSIRPKSTARNASFPLAICNHYSLITALFFGFIFGLSLRASFVLFTFLSMWMSKWRFSCCHSHLLCYLSVHACACQCWCSRWHKYIGNSISICNCTENIFFFSFRRQTKEIKMLSMPNRD